MFRIKLKELREKHGLSQYDLADKLGIKQSTIGMWENGTNNPRQSTLIKIADLFNVSVDYLLGKTADPRTLDQAAMAMAIEKFDNIIPIHTKKVPLLGNVACGEPIMCDQEYGYVEAGIEVNADFALRATGDSMINARIFDGDIVFIHAQPSVSNGEIAAVIVDDSATLKRVYFYPSENRLMLVAENPQYPPLIYTDAELEQIRILGKAIAFQSNVR